MVTSPSPSKPRNCSRPSRTSRVVPSSPGRLNPQKRPLRQSSTRLFSRPGLSATDNPARRGASVAVCRRFVGSRTAIPQLFLARLPAQKIGECERRRSSALPAGEDPDCGVGWRLPGGGMGAPVELKTVLITGGTDGLGRAAALLLAEQGYRVFAAGRSSEKRAALDQIARERGLPLETVEMDVCDDASVARALAEVHSKAGPLDVLVNNAGIGYFATMEEIRMDHLRQQFETNFFGVVRVTQAVLPEMRERRRGRILNMSSAAGKVALPLFGPYSGSKFALEGMSDALRLEVYPFGIDVVLIEPGYIRTGFQAISAELSSSYAAAERNSPYGKLYAAFRRATQEARNRSRYTPEDCARVALRAVEDHPPRPRYTVTRVARVASWAKRLLPDRLLDRRMIRTYGLERR